MVSPCVERHIPGGMGLFPGLINDGRQLFFYPLFFVLPFFCMFSVCLVFFGFFLLHHPSDVSDESRDLGGFYDFFPFAEIEMV